MSEPQELNLVVTEDRVKDMELETFYYIDNKSPKATVEFVAHFVCDEKGEYLEKPDAVKAVIVGRKVRDVEEIMEDLQAAMEEMAVPKE
jgi:hypothetical protein